MAAATLIAGLHLALAIAGVRSIPDAELLRQAETAFRAGITVRDDPDKAQPLFRQAASCYEKLRLRGVHNADLYRNLGNACLLGGDLPGAILVYRRGLRLAPNAPALRTSLAHAREQVTYPGLGSLGRPPTDNWPAWLPYFSSTERLLLFFCAYSLGWLGIVRWWMVRQSGPLLAGISGFSVALVVASSLVLQEWGERQEALHSLVVLARDGVVLRRGNGGLYPPRFETPLNRGVEARFLFERGDWIQIELSGGQAGWVPRSAVLLDTP